MNKRKYRPISRRLPKRAGGGNISPMFTHKELGVSARPSSTVVADTSTVPYDQAGALVGQTADSIDRNAGSGVSEWGQAGSGALSGAGTGAAIGSSIIPGPGTAIGAAVGGVVGGVGGYIKGKGEVGEREDSITRQQTAQEKQIQLQQFKAPTHAYTPTFEDGGRIITRSGNKEYVKRFNKLLGEDKSEEGRTNMERSARVANTNELLIDALLDKYKEQGHDVTKIRDILNSRQNYAERAEQVSKLLDEGKLPDLHLTEDERRDILMEHRYTEDDYNQYLKDFRYESDGWGASVRGDREKGDYPLYGLRSAMYSGPLSFYGETHPAADTQLRYERDSGNYLWEHIDSEDSIDTNLDNQDFEIKPLEKMALGGNIQTSNKGNEYEEYEGQTHKGPDEGIEIGQDGSPVATTGAEGIALTEDGEVRWNDYIFSNKLKLPGNKKRTFADETKRVKNKFKKRLGEDLDKHDPISKRDMDEALEELMMLQETVKGNTITKDDVEQMMQEQAMEMEQAMMQQQGTPQQQGMPMEGGMPPGGEVPMDQMPSEVVDGQPMMRRGGNLPKYSGLDVDTGVYRTGDVNFNLGPKTQAMMAHRYNTGGQSYEGLNLNQRTTGDMFRRGSVPKNVSTPQTGRGTEPSQEMVPMTGEISPIPAVISGASNLAGLMFDKDSSSYARMPRIRPQRLDLSEARRGVGQQAAQAREGHSANLQQSGATGTQYQRGSLAGQVGTQRVAGQQLADLNLQQQQFEAQERGRVDQFNAQMAAQESMYKTRQQMLDDEKRKQYISGLGAAASQYATDRRKAQDYAQMLNMQSDDYTLMRPKQRSIRDRITGRERLSKEFTGRQPKKP